MIRVRHERPQGLHAVVVVVGKSIAPPSAGRQLLEESAVDQVSQRGERGASLARHRRQHGFVGQSARMRLGEEPVDDAARVRHDERRRASADGELARVAGDACARYSPGVVTGGQHCIPVEPVVNRGRLLGMAVREGKAHRIRTGTDVGPTEIGRALLDRRAFARTDRGCSRVGRNKQVLRDRNAGLGVPRERHTRSQEKRERGSACGTSRSLAGNGRCRRNRKLWIASRLTRIGVSMPEIHDSYLALCGSLLVTE